jgi:hypothetical protein
MVGIMCEQLAAPVVLNAVCIAHFPQPAEPDRLPDDHVRLYANAASSSRLPAT